MKTPFVLPAMIAVLGLCPGATAQTEWSLEAVNPGLFEYDGNLPPLWVAGFVPAAPLGPVPPPLGGNDLDRFTATLWATDGFQIANFDQSGKALAAGPVPPPFMPLTGLAHDSIGFTLPNPPGALWLTDGFLAAPALAVPPFPLLVPPFPVTSPGGGMATGIAFDSFAPFPGALWVCFSDGFVGNFTTAGAPMGFWPAMPPLPGVPLGISFDTSAPTPGAVVVTDGAMVARFNPAGLPAAPSFYAPLPIYPVPPAPWGPALPVVGMGHSPTPLPYNFGWVFPASLDAVRQPEIRAQNWSGNNQFAITVSGLPAQPPVSYLVLGLSSFPGRLLVGPPWWFFRVPTPGGAAVVPTPIPGWVPPGIGVYLQFVHVGNDGWQTYSNGLYLTTSTL